MTKAREASPPEAAPGVDPPTRSARIAWFETLGAQVQRDRPAPDVVLPPPDGVRAERGRGQVTVSWTPVDGAAGYLVHRGSTADDLEPLDHRGGDVLAVPHGPYVDTVGDIDGDHVYAVASLASIDGPVGPVSPPVRPAAPAGGVTAGVVELTVDAGRVVGRVERPWRPIIGSEHLQLLLRGDGPGGIPIGDDLARAFEIVRDELGVERVRAHGLLHDSLGVVTDDGRGGVRYDFERMDAALDRLLATGLRPIVELSFMPAALAADPDVSVFDYVGIISPPRDLEAWHDLVTALVRHLLERFGRDEVRAWPFEVWNEPNLRVFWAGRQSEYFDLYDASAAAIKAVDPALLVGGPSTAAVGWVDDLLHHAATTGVPVDFITTHTYGAQPLDLRPILARAGRADLPLWWTEWGVSPTHGSPVNDSVWGAPLVARGMRSAAGRLDALAYWVASDQFVELGIPERLFHGGFGLLTIGGLRKPRFWALAILEQLAPDTLAVDGRGDGAGSLVEAWASRDPGDGRVAIALWNGTLDQTKTEGHRPLDREVRLELTGLPPGTYRLRHRRVDHEHSNIARHWEARGGGDWPDDAAWAELRGLDRLEPLEPERRITVGGDGTATTTFDLPMPAVSLVELLPD